MRSTLQRHWYVWGLLIGAASGLAGCTSVAQPERAPDENALRPQWSEATLAEHLRFFNSEDVGGRKTGTQGYARVAAYAMAQMRASGLQPAFGDDFRSVYQTPVYYPRSATMQVLRPDTLRFYPGIDFIPGGQSDAGEVQFREVKIGLETALAQPEPGMVVMVQQPAPTRALKALQAAGARAVLYMGELTPRSAASPVQGLLVIQLTPRATAHMMGATESEPPQSLWSAKARALPHPVRLRVQVTYEPLAGALNVIGYIAGKRPDFAREAVLVCADLDAPGPFAGVRTLDPTRLGTEAAVLLELARYQAELSQFLTIPERTMIFALWSGSRLNHAGLQAYLRNPTWALRQLHAVIYIGLPASDVAAVQALLAPYGVPLYVVEPVETVDAQKELVLVPDAALLRLARARYGSASVPSPSVDVPGLLRDATAEALTLAEKAEPLILGEALGAAPLLPTLPDTLRPPPGVLR